MSRVVLLLCTLLAVLAVAPAASAQDVSGAADGLRAAPLHVDPSLRSSFTADERRRLVRELRAQDPPVLVAIVPLVPGDAVDGEPRQFLEVLRRRLGTDAILVTVEGGSLVAEAGAADRDRVGAASSVANLEGEYQEPAVLSVGRFLDALDDPDVQARAERARARLSDGARPVPTVAPPSPQEDGDGSGGPSAGLAAGIAGALLVLGGAALVRRRGRARPVRDAPAVLPQHVFEAARDARHDQLRATLDEELVAFAYVLDHSPTPGSGAAAEHWQRALEHRDAAAAIARDPQARDVDLIGALVLEDRARAELATAGALESGQRVPPAAAPPCGLNPTHARSITKVRWGGSPRLPVCHACRDDVRAGRRPDVLEDRGRSYLEQDTAWAATAFGTLAGDLLAAVRADRARRR